MNTLTELKNAKAVILALTAISAFGYPKGFRLICLSMKAASLIREREAMADVEKAKGIEPQFHPYNKPRVKAYMGPPFKVRPVLPQESESSIH